MISERIEAYAAAHSSPESPLFRDLVRVTRQKTRLPQMQVGHLEGRFLHLLTRISGAKRVLEIGTFTGYSTLSFAEALPPGGHVTTLDIDPINTSIARSFLKKAGLEKKVSIVIGPALLSLKKIRGPFDVAFIDADKENYLRYWNAVLPLVRRGGLLIVDNVLWSGRVLAPKDQTDRAIAAFNRQVRNDKRVDLVMVTVRDGITLGVKK